MDTRTPPPRRSRPAAAKLLAVLGLSALCLCVLPAPSALAQDWGAEESGSRSGEIARRYRSLLDRRPAEGLILDRLLQEVGGGSGFERLLADYLAQGAENPGHFGYAAISGHLLKRAGRLDEAAEAYARAESIDPDSYIGPLGLGEVLQRLGRLDEAAAAYERAIERIPDRFERQQVLFRLADLAFDSGDFARASSLLERVVADNPRDVYVRMQLADVYLEYGRLEEALAQYEAIVDLAGTNTQQRAVTTGLAGDVLLQLGRTDDAVARYRRAQALTTRGSWLWDDLERRVVEAYRQSGDLEGLVADYEARWTRPDAEQMRTLAGLYEELGRDQDALAMLRAAVARDRRDVDTRLDLVRLLERLGLLDEAIVEYRGIVELSDEPVHATRLADMLRRAGDADAGLEVLADAQRRYRNNPSALTMLADAYLRAGQRELAVPIFERVVELEPDDPDRILSLGDIYLMVGRREDALATWQRVLEVGDDRAESLALLGYTYAGHHMIDEAIAQFEAARALEPDRVEYLRALAEVTDEARRVAQALEYWAELAEVAPDEDTRSEALRRRVELLDDQGLLGPRVAEAEAAWAASSDPAQGRFLGQAYLRQGRLDDAELVFLALLEVDPDDATALLALADIYEASQRPDEAIAALARVAERTEWSPSALYDRIVDLALRGYDGDTAIRYANLAIQGDPMDAAAHARLGRVHRQLGALDRAALALTEATRIDRRGHRFAFDLAEVYVGLGQREEAGDLYREVVADARDEAAVLRAGRRAIQIQQSLGDLGALLPEWAGLLGRAGADPAQQVTVQRLFLELVEQLAQPDVAAVRQGFPEERADARARLDALADAAGRGLTMALANDAAGLAYPALVLIGDLRYEAAVPAVASLLAGADADTAVQAAVTLGLLGEASATPALVEALRAGGPTLQAAAAWALGATGGQGASAALVEALRASSPDVRVAAAYALGQQAGPGVADALIDAASQAGDVGIAAVLALGASGAAAGRSALLATLSDSAGDELRRAAAAAALGRLPYDADSARALLRAYWTATPRVRWAAARALRRLGEPAARGGEGLAAPIPWDSDRRTWSAGALLAEVASDELLPLEPATFGFSGERAEDVAAVVDDLLAAGEAGEVFRVLEDLNDGGGLTLGLATWGAQTDALGSAIEPMLRRRLPELVNHPDPAVRDQVQLLVRSLER